MDWENHLKSNTKNPIQKIDETEKITSEIATCEQKTTSEKPNVCSNNVFSLNFKIRAKKIYAVKPLAFSLHFLFRCHQNPYPNLTSKIMKMCEQILKKDSAPIQFKFFEVQKTTMSPIIAAIVLRLLETYHKVECSISKVRFSPL